MIVDALVSPPYYRLLFALSPLDDAALIDLLETVWRGCRRSDALPSTAHAAAAARSIRASRDRESPTKPRLKKKTPDLQGVLSQSTIQYRAQTTIANGAFRAADERRRPASGVCVRPPTPTYGGVSNPASGCPCRRQTHSSDDCRSLNSGSGHASLDCYLIRSGIYR